MMNTVIIMMYAICVSAGKEFRVLEEIKKISGAEALLPTYIAEIRRGGVWRPVQKIFIPGYIFIKCRFSPVLYYKIKGINGVSGWIGRGSPEAMSPEDEKFTEFLSNGGEPIPLQDITSPFVKKTIIKRIDRHARRITATMRICGKLHTVTFGYKR